MESIAQSQTPPPGPEATLSLGSRFVAVFARPARAWTGLERRGQWWFPMLVAMIVTLAGALAIYQRALVPMGLDQIQRQVESGQMPPESAAQAERAMSSPVMMAVQVGMQTVAVPVMTLLIALLPWLVAGFMLGFRFRYRDAFVVTSWAGLVTLPASVLTYALAWVNQTMTTVHTGFGVLLPVEDTPSKLMVGLGTFLDQGIGPFSLWYVAVMGLGAAALSGAPARRVLIALGGLWIVAWIIFSALAMLFAPGA